MCTLLDHRLTRLSSEQTLHGCFLTVSVVALVNRLAFHTVLHTDWEMGPWGWLIWLISARAAPRVTSLFKLRRPVRRREHDNCQYIVCHRTTKGDPYFIYEYAAWSFLIFNKEIWFTHLFLTVLCLFFILIPSNFASELLRFILFLLIPTWLSGSYCFVDQLLYFCSLSLVWMDCERLLVMLFVFFCLHLELFSCANPFCMCCSAQHCCLGHAQYLCSASDCLSFFLRF